VERERITARGRAGGGRDDYRERSRFGAGSASDRVWVGVWARDVASTGELLADASGERTLQEPRIYRIATVGRG
jgi:hypothetical protein